MGSSKTTSDIAIVGAGIVGSALAYYLSHSTNNNKKVVLIDRSFSQLKGSTGHAPGFVGQFNDSEVLTRLAMDTVREYTNIPGGFDVVGGLEIATSCEGVDRLRSRCEMAKRAGLSAQLISSGQAVSLAPDLVKDDNQIALYFPGDGAANAIRITSFYQEQARAKGVELIEANTTEVHQVNGRVEGVMTTSGLISARKVIIATGIWATDLCKFDIPIPIVPVAHPYMYGEHHTPKLRKAPWVRWPQHHVYARDHGDFFGLGSYNHAPVFHEPKETAIGDWIEQFDQTLNEAMHFIPEETKLVQRERFNGIFSMTPDNMPLVGNIPSVEGLYMAAAVWVTHAAGAAKFLTQILEEQPVDDGIKRALDPTRFQGRDIATLTQESLNGYNDIYKTDESGALRM
ncbi:NAD(P)/FAD-dependent oxidoreductase [Aspergillus alliaceus]|uniref:NAD(P)/FAD-dependent oxidoreductase n=1 Tax=Petromyces alliaceus TaxID=209559 RepID=UPI0012A40582|nr:FAD dependent oxidoreductase [Aspergillus alliaceus]KAB8239215.1 FAD dependent oxidoreductase [Aspergillus alliaceus]